MLTGCKSHPAIFCKVWITPSPLLPSVYHTRPPYTRCDLHLPMSLDMTEILCISYWLYEHLSLTALYVPNCNGLHLQHFSLTKTTYVIDQIPKSLPLDVRVAHLSLTKTTFVIDQIPKSLPLDVCVAHLSLTKTTFVIDQPIHSQF